MRRSRLTVVAFDVLRVNGYDLTSSPWSARRAVLEELGVETWCSRLADVFDDGHALFDAIAKHGLEGIVAKRTTGAYRPRQRGWIKVKNPDYWRRDQEIEALRAVTLPGELRATAQVLALASVIPGEAW
jgi:bifunctional non-homologous end joining protein LigD